MSLITSAISSSRHECSGDTSRRTGPVVDALLEARNLFNVQTIRYDLMAVCSMDLDPSNSFLLVGLSNGSVDLQAITDSTMGRLEQITRLNLSAYNLNRVQWNPGDEQFFATLDNHTLYLVDPVEMRAIDKFEFSAKTSWLEWNPNDKKMIAVCGSESQTRLVDIRSGSSAQTIILAAKSGMSSHRSTRCLWSKHDINCLIIGDNEGYVHVYDTRSSAKPRLVVGEERGQISGMCFKSDHTTLITSQGTENHLVEWTYEGGSLRPASNKFRKRPKPESEDPDAAIIAGPSPKAAEKRNVTGKPVGRGGTARGAGKGEEARNGAQAPGTTSTGTVKKAQLRKHGRRIIPLPVDAHIRCQFYVTDRHVFCPAPARATNSKELHVYDALKGYRLKTIKSEDILSQGVYAVTGLLPESVVLYSGGRGRLRVWTIDEAYQLKADERRRKYHQTRWESDDDEP